MGGPDRISHFGDRRTNRIGVFPVRPSGNECAALAERLEAFPVTGFIHRIGEVPASSRSDPVH